MPVEANGLARLHKPPGNDFEVYNDFNGLLVNLYRCVRDKPEELMEALRYGKAPAGSAVGTAFHVQGR